MGWFLCVLDDFYPRQAVPLDEHYRKTGSDHFYFMILCFLSLLWFAATEIPNTRGPAFSKRLGEGVWNSPLISPLCCLPQAQALYQVCVWERSLSQQAVWGYRQMNSWGGKVVLGLLISFTDWLSLWPFSFNACVWTLTPSQIASPSHPLLPPPVLEPGLYGALATGVSNLPSVSHPHPLCPYCLVGAGSMASIMSKAFQKVENCSLSLL